MTPTPRHLPRLEPLRGLAVLMVLAYHCLYAAYGTDHLPFYGSFRSPLHQPRGFLLLFPLQFGWTGVSLFFVLSGFVIRLSAPTTPLDFLRRRFWRLFPSYGLALFAAAVLWHFHPMWPIERPGHHLAAHLLLIHNALDRSYFTLNPSFWSLAVEAQFYLLYPALIWLIPRCGWRSILTLALTASVILRVGLFIHLTQHGRPGWIDDKFYWWNTPQLWFDWAFGAFLADRHTAGRVVFARPVTSASTFAALTVLTSFYAPTVPFTFTLSSMFWAVLIERIARRQSPTLWPLTILGQCSYSFYLWHQPLLNLLRSLIHLQNALTVPVLFLTALITIAPWSWLLYRLVEFPTRRLGRPTRAIRT